MRRISFLCVATVLGVAPVVGFAASAQATTTVNVSTWSQLQSAFSTAALNATTTIVVTSDITEAAASDSYLSVHNENASGTASIILNLNGHSVSIGKNTSFNSGIEVRKGASLIIESEGPGGSMPGGSLIVDGGDYAGAIGVSYEQSDNQPDAFQGGGRVTVKSGNVTVLAGDYGSGFGGGYYYGGLDLFISGGVVSATGGLNGAGIGSASWQYLNNDPTNVTISGGSVTAQGGAEGGPGIGRAIGVGAVGPSTVLAAALTLSDCATVHAQGGSGGDYSTSPPVHIGAGAAIGSGGVDNNGIVTVADGLVVNGVTQSGAPTSAGSGFGSPTVGGAGSQITYTGLSANVWTITSTAGATTDDGGSFSATCHKKPTPAPLPNTGSTPLAGVNVAAWLMAMGAMIVAVAAGAKARRR